MKTYILLAIALFVTGATHALDTGPVRDLQVSSDGAITFRILLQTGSSSLPACATTNAFVILDENSNAGRYQLALLIPANADDQFANMDVHPTGQCTRLAGHGDVEFVRR